MRLGGIALLILLCGAGPLGAQAPWSDADGPHHRMGPPHGGRTFISPMGQPFRDAPDNAAAWFAAADADHDGKISLAEFRADAMRFFAMLDVDHDHEIGPEEIERYEREIAPETGSGGGETGAPSRARGGDGDHRRGGRGGGGHGGGISGSRGGGDGPPGGEGGAPHAGGPAIDSRQQGAARYSYLALPEPVIAADADFNRGVSQQEFFQAASRRFALLDTNHDGVLTAEELPKLGGEIRGGHGHQGSKPPPVDE